MNDLLRIQEAVAWRLRHREFHLKLIPTVRLMFDRVTDGVIVHVARGTVAREDFISGQSLAAADRIGGATAVVLDVVERLEATMDRCIAHDDCRSNLALAKACFEADPR